ncbi:MAG: putative pyridoxal-dependent aspartate 1-decarboxylase [Thermodesulfobacteriota bacterium]|nr:putative pyridoxal-dependent aspartate 1-decarboxylase [Thermodesulfobacteriota bacterium]
MNSDYLKKEQHRLVADWDTLQRIFIKPEDDECKKVLLKYMEQIFFGLHDFLNRHVGVTEEISLKALTEKFKGTLISEHPEKKLAEVISDIINELAPKAVNVASPYFVGHMTAAIPFFMVHLKAIVAALNQNVIKLETSKVLSVLERQVLAKIHRLIFNRSEEFYAQHVQSINTSLGAFTTGGTTANLTALWVARNKLFFPCNGFKSIEAQGFFSALKAHCLEKVVVLVSRRGHYSLKKAGGILGLGSENVIPVDVDREHRIDLKKLNNLIKGFKKSGSTGIVAVVGIAGATETGSVDPLEDMADICQNHSIHFHVDSAWGGPVLFSEKYSWLLKGINRADSVSMDGHKQFYMPMTSGMVYFRDPDAMEHIAYYSNYVNRQGSVDLGIKSLEGSREANSLILDSALKIMGCRGYALLIDHGIETAREFADEIRKRDLFEVVTEPELNILTYRIVPKNFREQFLRADSNEKERLNRELNQINTMVQRKQREAGKSFVSRTRIRMEPGDKEMAVVLRCVLMNPMTDMTILNEILDEQEEIFTTGITGTAGAWFPHRPQYPKGQKPNLESLSLQSFGWTFI